MDKDEREMKELMRTSGFGWRVSLTILFAIGWFVFLIIWLFFYAGSFSIAQNIAIFLASVLLFGGFMAAIWAAWGMRYGMKYSRMDWNYCGECCPRMPVRRAKRARKK